MERKTSSLRFTRGRLAALLSAVVLVTIVVFSLTFYHLCLHAKRMEVLTQGDGPLWAFEQGQLDILSQEADGATVYGGSGSASQSGTERSPQSRMRTWGSPSSTRGAF